MSSCHIMLTLLMFVFARVGSLAIHGSRAGACALGHAATSRCGTALRLSGGAGGVGARYTFSDEDEVARIVMPVGEGVRARDVTFELKQSILTLGLRDSEAPLINSEPLWGKARSCCSTTARPRVILRLPQNWKPRTSEAAPAANYVPPALLNFSRREPENKKQREERSPASQMCATPPHITPRNAT
jgi:hypothetical protein